MYFLLNEFKTDPVADSYNLTETEFNLFVGPAL